MGTGDVALGRRWLADPLALLAVLALGALALVLVPAGGAALVVLAVVVAGVSLSGST